MKSLIEKSLIDRIAQGTTTVADARRVSAIIENLARYELVLAQIASGVGVQAELAKRALAGDGYDPASKET